MNERENLLALMKWQDYEFTPLSTRSIVNVGLIPINLLEQPLVIQPPATEAVDGWGVPWVTTTDGTISKPGFSLCEDIEDWKTCFHFPDLDKIDFKAFAEMEMANINPKESVVTLFYSAGLFMRLIYNMGFMNGLMAIAENPEACAEFFEACTKYQIDFIGRCIDVYHPDVVLYGEDVATGSSLFFSLDIYRKYLKPYHKMVFDYIHSRGLLVQVHTCGYCTDVLDDYIEIGVDSWTSAQPTNDIGKLLDKYQGKLTIQGGWDTQGKCSQIGAEPQLAIEEADRCMKEYGSKKGFILEPVLLNEKGNSVLVGDDRLPLIEEVWTKYRS